MYMVDLEELTQENTYYVFDPECIRKRSNLSKANDAYKLDSPDYNPELLLKHVTSQSPKLEKLLENIEKLDKRDKEKDGHYYKHFIFCDLKSSNYGAKLLASAMVAKGYTLGYYAKRKDEAPSPESVKEKTPKVREDTPRPDDKLVVKKMPKFDELSAIEEGSKEDDSMEGGQKKAKKPKKIYQKIDFLSENKLEKTKNENFYLLSSTDVYDQTISVKDKKRILSTFNERPKNVHGEQIRFIVMDSGFKEGIDLFDIKYIHIFEPPVNQADKKQVIGRGTRTCGQKGLEFHPSKGWPLHVFIYDLAIPKPLQSQFGNAETAMALYLQSLNMDLRLVEFGADLEQTIVYGAVDHDLTKKIHNFSLEKASSDDQELLFGGGPKVNRRKLKVADIPAIVVQSDTAEVVTLPSGQQVPGFSLKDMTFEKMRKYILSNFSHCSWNDVNMENLCKEKPGKKEVDSIISYTPTQRFIQEYFSPQAPIKGMLLWHSVGTGKTCSAIASSTASFVPQGYTILWVTRTTLKNDIWKNMFDQICNEQIRKMVRDGVEIPKDHNKRMRLLSQAWKIRPLSYKQFSNLVSKENDYYRKLVEINGAQDPLRKTLLIIDEAHKLYGGGDLSSIERPDMPALHKSLMNSYNISGKDSVRLLLMTATPITENPLEIVKLLNLCKPMDKQLPAEFPEFSLKYLKEDGQFSKDGKTEFLNNIAGYVSYLNREKDARQFAQPIIYNVEVPLVKDLKEVEKMDRKHYKEVLSKELKPLEDAIKKENEKIHEDMRDLDRTRFYEIKDICNPYEGKVKKMCEKLANANIKKLVDEVRALTKEIKDNVKELKKQLKEKKTTRKDLLKMQKETLKEMPEGEKASFKDSVFYLLKYKCGKKKVENASLKDLEKEHPKIQEFDLKISGIQQNIEKMELSLKDLNEAHKKKVKELKELLRLDLNHLERSVVQTVLKDLQASHKNTLKLRKKEVAKETEALKKEEKEIMKERNKKTKKLRKTIKEMRKDEQAKKKEQDREKKALRKTLRKQGTLREEFKGEFMKDKIQEYKKDVKMKFDVIKDALLEEQRQKQEAKEKKEQEREEKRRIKEREREIKLRKKEAERAAKMKAKEAEKKKKEAEKTRKKREKEALRKSQKKR